jgi:hypothetical protein
MCSFYCDCTSVYGKVHLRKFLEAMETGRYGFEDVLNIKSLFILQNYLGLSGTVSYQVKSALKPFGPQLESVVINKVSLPTICSYLCHKIIWKSLDSIPEFCFVGLHS